MEKMIKTAASDQSSALLEAAHEKWERVSPLLSAVVPHENIDEVSESLRRSKSYLTSDDNSEFLSEIEYLLFALEIIENYDTPTWRAVF